MNLYALCYEVGYIQSKSNTKLETQASKSSLQQNKKSHIPLIIPMMVLRSLDTEKLYNFKFGEIKRQKKQYEKCMKNYIMFMDG